MQHIKIVDVVLLLALLLTLTIVLIKDPRNLFKNPHSHELIEIDEEPEVKPEDIMEVTDTEVIIHFEYLLKDKLQYFRPFKDSKLEIIGISQMDGTPLFALNLCNKCRKYSDGYFTQDRQYSMCAHTRMATSLWNIFHLEAEHCVVEVNYKLDSDKRTVTFKISDLRKKEKLFKKIKKFDSDN